MRRRGNGLRSAGALRPTIATTFSPKSWRRRCIARSGGSGDIADFPNPDLAIEVDITPPQTDRAGIYAALRVAEVWRLTAGDLVIERLTAEGTYTAVEASGFLPVRAEVVRRWVLEEDSADESAWARRLRAELRG